MILSIINHSLLFIRIKIILTIIFLSFLSISVIAQSPLYPKAKNVVDVGFQTNRGLSSGQPFFYGPVIGGTILSSFDFGASFSQTRIRDNKVNYTTLGMSFNNFKNHNSDFASTIDFSYQDELGSSRSRKLTTIGLTAFFGENASKNKQSILFIGSYDLIIGKNKYRRHSYQAGLLFNFKTDLGLASVNIVFSQVLKEERGIQFSVIKHIVINNKVEESIE